MRPITRRRFAAGVAGAAVLAMPRAFAQGSWPEKPIKLVVPFPPGGGADFLGRLLAERLGEGLRQSIVVDNKPGAATTIGADAVIVERLSGELKRMLAEPEMAEKMIQNGLTPAFSSPDAFRAEITADIARFAKLVKDVGITMQ